MIRYYSSRELSRMLQIPLNRWKRWSREFLSPDPLGGLQSGYARQFSTREAFTVYLGGFLVAGLGFSIPLARQVIRDLNGWMKKKILDDYLFGRGAVHGDRRTAQVRYEVHIMGRVVVPGHENGKLAYQIREIAQRQLVEDGNPSQWMEAYNEVVLKPQPESREGGYPPVRCLLDISDLADRFACLVKQPIVGQTGV